MSQEAQLIRKSYFVDPKLVHEATKLSGASSEAAAIRKIIAQYLEQERFWQFMKKTAGRAGKNSFRRF